MTSDAAIPMRNAPPHYGLASDSGSRLTRHYMHAANPDATPPPRNPLHLSRPRVGGCSFSFPTITRLTAVHVTRPMYLVHTDTLRLEEFVRPRKPPPYAILSHTWGEEELTYEEIDNQDRSACETKEGYRKFVEACRQAKDLNLQYIWIDTCCIQKSSSSQVAEGINSMFQYYAEAKICLAYLSDFDKSLINTAPAASQNHVSFEKCRWFTRGWTLQELIAPKTVLFYDKNWTQCGSKEESGYILQTITKVDEDVLTGKTSLESVSIARRMSWAANRETTLIEDMAYCLLGIFDVNITTIYGEGLKSFQRLQEEIMQQSNDFSLFAWRADSTGTNYRGLLATSPKEFAHCSRVHCQYDFEFNNSELSSTSKGIKLDTELVGHPDGSYVLDLRCYVDDVANVPIKLALRKVHDNAFVRENPTVLDDCTSSWNCPYGLRFIVKGTFYFLKHIDQHLYQRLQLSFNTPFIFREGFDSQWQFLDYTWRWRAEIPQINHRYNNIRTLRTRFPPIATITGGISIDMLPERQMGSPTTYNFRVFFVLGVYTDEAPWIYVSLEPGVFTDQVKVSLASGLEKELRGTDKQLEGIATGTNHDGITLKITAKIFQGFVDAKRVYFVDLTSINVTKAIHVS